MNFDYIKLVFSVLASVLLAVGYIPYFRDIFLGKTKPHLYTWLIWLITMGTAAAASWRGGARFGALCMIFGLIFVLAIILLSFKYGTKNIKKTDTIVFIAALFAILVWWQFKNPLLAVFVVSAIDGLGYIPTLRKSFEEPWSETLSFWLIMAIVDILIILSSDKYNFLTVTYMATLAAANTTVLLVCFIRRKFK